MKRKKSNRPIEAYDDIMFNEAGSATDCTGLIPSAVLNQSEYESYEDLMDFNIPKLYIDSEEE